MFSRIADFTKIESQESRACASAVSLAMTMPFCKWLEHLYTRQNLMALFVPIQWVLHKESDCFPPTELLLVPVIGNSSGFVRVFMIMLVPSCRLITGRQSPQNTVQHPSKFETVTYWLLFALMCVCVCYCDQATMRRAICVEMHSAIFHRYRRWFMRFRSFVLFWAICEINFFKDTK